jgi:hypothetical protein
MSKFLTVAKNYLDPEVEEEPQNRLSHMETCVAECVWAGQGKKLSASSKSHSPR